MESHGLSSEDPLVSRWSRSGEDTSKRDLIVAMLVCSCSRGCRVSGSVSVCVGMCVRVCGCGEEAKRKEKKRKKKNGKDSKIKKGKGEGESEGRKTILLGWIRKGCDQRERASTKEKHRGGECLLLTLANLHK